MKRQIVIISAILAILIGGGVAMAQLVDPVEPAAEDKIDFDTKFPQPKVIGPPPPMADIWTFEEIKINPTDGSIYAVQLVTLTQPDDDKGNAVPPKRMATFGINVTNKRAREILGDAEYELLMNTLSNDLHLIAKAEGTEPIN